MCLGSFKIILYEQMFYLSLFCGFYQVWQPLLWLNHSLQFLLLLSMCKVAVLTKKLGERLIEVSTIPYSRVLFSFFVQLFATVRFFFRYPQIAAGLRAAELLLEWQASNLALQIICFAFQRYILIYIYIPALAILEQEE